MTTPNQSASSCVKVSDLIDIETNWWNASLINSVFHERDAHEILHIPLIDLGRKDEIIWRYDKKGLFSVKSAYRVCVDVLINREEWRVQGDWNKLWELPIPPKIKHFIWRLGRDCLPNRQCLVSKGVDCTENCVICQVYTEYNWHAFLNCADSVACWRKVKIWEKLETIMQQVDNFSQFFIHICSRLDEGQLVIFAMVAWSIWKKRNTKLWENIHEPVEKVVCRAQGVLNAWQNGNRWKPPPTEFLKCNVDAPLFTISNQVSMGACIRDEKGQFIAATTRYINAKLTPAEGEAWGLQQAMIWMEMLGYHKVIFEMDCKMVVDDVHNKKHNLTEYGSLIDECRTILSNYSNFIVAFTRRQANGSAHALARAALSHASRAIFDVIPNCITTIIINEIP